MWKTWQKWPVLPRMKDIVSIQRLLHSGPYTLKELLDRQHVFKKEKPINHDEKEMLTQGRLTSNRREAISLYRDILRATRFFMWPDSSGVLWRDILRDNTRKEFEKARFERNMDVVTWLLIGGRNGVEQLEKLAEKQKQQIEKERGGGDPR